MSDLFHTDRVTVAVVTGQHPFEVPGFHHCFRSLPGIDYYPQHMEDYVADVAHARQQYDVVLFYNFHQQTPDPNAGPAQAAMRQALEELGETNQGIVVLHHALLAFPGWQLWTDIMGIPDRRFGFYHDERVYTEIADPNHPITQGLSPWEMVDETYTMDDAGEGSHILLTTNHPRSMHTLAWTRQYRNARVFCYEGGHDNQTFTNPNFRTVLGRGILWAAGRL
ncbi:MAG: ThuA domain-containing protein [Chloroflexi bacterium]|jgi:type 1 glutamine amidotransferase|nr:ThuA domain-containing protein [Chloroflexota bacterium]